jgi:two-component system, chemotaxis family, protein-glutamate methylesterase/glutaminase
VTSGAPKLRVLVVEDSPLMRHLLVHIVNGDSEMEVVGEASDGREAVTLAGRLRPDVILMDIILPGMDGLGATQTIMHEFPTPIVLITAAYDPRDKTKTFEALASGALTVLSKPQGPGTHGFADEVANLTITLKLMAQVKLVRRHRSRQAHEPPSLSRAPRTVTSDQPIEAVAIAASTGGPAALATVLAALPESTPVPILVVQHITPGFHDGLVTWLNGVTPLSVRLAEHGAWLRSGEVLIAPPGRHLGVSQEGRVDLSPDPPISGHRPSATYLFDSMTRAYGDRALGVILTGMGDDGVAGLRTLKGAGGVVMAQDQATSVVYGMPREAAILGVVDRVVPVELIGPTLVHLLNGGNR